MNNGVSMSYSIHWFTRQHIFIVGGFGAWGEKNLAPSTLADDRRLVGTIGGLILAVC